ncbi:MAG: hypothetical protein QM813_09295 [Verrucomicrobiota bacterium]
MIADPTPTYFVGYTGTCGAVNCSVIPNEHRRSGDVEYNKQVRVIIQDIDPFNATVSIPSYPWLNLLDENNTLIRRLFIDNRAYDLETEQRLKISAENFGFYTAASFAIAVFYKKPDR